MGGTGKTPAVLYLAEKLKAAGYRPGILTRGHGRQSPEKRLALEAGARIPSRHSGDEAQIFLNSAVAPVGIGRDRWMAGALLEKKFGVDVIVLDDGFQHLRLARQVDIVLIDALDPFRGGDVFPLGRLREPLDQLSRADIFVITRSDYSPLRAAIETELRRHNPLAPIFHAGVKPEYWIEFSSGAHMERPPFRQAGAFCGLGNPRSFWRTLAALGIEPVEEVEFADHHSYRPRELQHLAHNFELKGADAMLTTEKDAMNLCDGCLDIIAPLRLYWLKIGPTVEEEAEFLREIERRLAGVQVK
jgi:tetraacyldisaccharide 4'-kinase